MQRWRLSLVAALLFPNWASACMLPAGWVPLTPENVDSAAAAFFISDQPVPVSQPFDTMIWFCTKDAPQTVTVTAIMPAHQHGMNYRPAISARDDGTFVASGMVFHMPGQWRLDIAVTTDTGTTRYSSELIAR